MTFHCTDIYLIDLKMVTDATGKIMDSARKGNRK
jgi:hypothetical protein